MMCPMQSQENAEVLLDYCARTLPADTLARLDAHVAICSSCRQELSAQQQLWSALDEFDASELRISADFDRRLYARIDAERQDSLWVRGWRSIFASGQPGAWRPSFSMALAGVAVMALLLVRMPNPFAIETTPVAKSSVAVSVTEETMPQAAGSEAAVKTATVDSKDVERLDSALEDLEMLHVLGSTTGASQKNAL